MDRETVKVLLRAATLFALVAAPLPNTALAATATNTINVKVTVGTACTVSATDLNFGSFAVSIPANTTATSTATVSCTKGTSYALSFVFKNSLSAAKNTATVNMVNGANPTIPADLTVSTTIRTATGGNDVTTINGRIVAAVTNPALGTYTAPQAIYVLY
jgi:spore coat protein U-like protein